MGMLDAKTVFSNQQSVAVSSGGSVVCGSTAWSGAISSGGGQIVDQGKAGDAVGQELTLKVTAGGVAITGASASSALQVVLQTAGDDGISSGSAVDSAFKDLILSPVITVGSAGFKGSLFECRVPAGAKRYLRVVYKNSGAAITSGTINAYLTRDL